MSEGRQEEKQGNGAMKRTQEDREKEEAAEANVEVEGEEGEEEEVEGFVDLDGEGEMGYLIPLDDLEEGEEGEEGEGEEGEDTVPDMGEEEPVVAVDDMAVAKFEGHTDSVLCVAVSHNGRWAVSGGCDEAAWLWTLPGARPVCRLPAESAEGGAQKEKEGHADSVAVARFSSDDALVATGGLDGAVCVWSVPAGRALRRLEGPAADVGWLAWHPRGPVVVAGAVDSTVWLWNARSGDCLGVLAAHTDDVAAGAIVAGGTRLLTGSADATLKLWDPRDAAAPLFSADARAPVLALAVSATEPLAVAGLADNSALLLNLSTGKTVTRLQGHEGVVEAVAFVSMFVFFCSFLSRR